MVSHRLIGHAVRPPINAMLEKGIVIQIAIVQVVLHAEQIIAEQRHNLEAIGEVAQIAALQFLQHQRLPDLLDNAMAFLLPIGVAALAPLLVMLEEVTVIPILTVLQA